MKKHYIDKHILKFLLSDKSVAEAFDNRNGNKDIFQVIADVYNNNFHRYITRDDAKVCAIRYIVPNGYYKYSYMQCMFNNLFNFDRSIIPTWYIVYLKAYEKLYSIVRQK